MRYLRGSFDATFENLADKHFICDLSQLPTIFSNVLSFRNQCCSYEVNTLQDGNEKTIPVNFLLVTVNKVFLKRKSPVSSSVIASHY